MNDKAFFTPMDLQTWPRAQHAWYYSTMAKVGYSVTVDLDITELRIALKRSKRKFYPAFLHAATFVANHVPEMRTARKILSPESHESPQDPVIGRWNYLTPTYAVFHNDDKTFSTMYTDWDNDFSAFYANYEADQRDYGDVHGLLSKGVPPENSLIVSSMPWISFNNYSPVSYSGADYLLPILEAGKFRDVAGRCLLPFSALVHHAATDGYHLAKYLEMLQELMNTADSWA